MKEFLQLSFNEQCELRVPHPFAAFWRMGGIAQCSPTRNQQQPPNPRTNIAATLDKEINARSSASPVESRRISASLPARLKFMSELNENKNVAATSLRLKVGLAE